MKIVTLCGCGLGTSLLLKFTAEKAVNELGIQAEIIPEAIGNCDHYDADLYLMPLGLDLEWGDRSCRVVSIRNAISVSEVRSAIEACLSARWRKDS